MNVAQRGVDTVVIATQLITDGATVTGNWDTRGGAHATVRIPFSIEESTYAADTTVSLLESDDTVASNFATITADQSVDLTAAKEVRYEVDLRGRKRYLRLSVTAGSETGGEIMCGAIGTLTRYKSGPSSTTDMGDDTVVIV